MLGDYRVLLTIQLGLASDLETVQSMAKQFVREYLARPGMRNCSVRIFFPTIPKHEVKGK
ncbi:hypothetical protein H0W91_01740 [Patescibacteria group bacterium]|nr:hypothetical protein [Patescibacteria group bacterium]